MKNKPLTYPIGCNKSIFAKIMNSPISVNPRQIAKLCALCVCECVCPRVPVCTQILGLGLSNLLSKVICNTRFHHHENDYYKCDLWDSEWASASVWEERTPLGRFTWDTNSEPNKVGSRASPTSAPPHNRYSILFLLLLKICMSIWEINIKGKENAE